MEKIKFMADTASDIPDEDLQEYGIDMPSVPITVDGHGYFERKSFSIAEFYKVLEDSREIPTTSRVPTDDYMNCYWNAYKQGYTDIINVTINSAGSGTNASAQMAREMFYQKHHDARGKINIHVVDSHTYSAGYGYPVILAAGMARDGKSVREILDFLDDFFARSEIFLGCYSLDYARKSGRISAASAFVGDMLGLRPVIEMVDDSTNMVAKVRGDNKIVPQLLDCYYNSGARREDPVAVVYGSDIYYAKELQEALQEETGRPVPIFRAGASIIINSGPHMAAVIALAPNRRNR